MSSSSVIAIVIAGIALLGTLAQAVVPTLMQDRNAARARLESYREPLLTAAYELQARLHNILCNEFIEDWVEDRKQARMAASAMQTTLYVFAQFIAWREIIRRDLQFLRFSSTAETREVNALLQDITETILSSTLGLQFMIWRVEQQGFGERMIEERNGRPVCIGYGTFLERHDALSRWLGPLERDLREIDDQGRVRLTALQRQLVRLVRKLDTDGIWGPQDLKEA